MNYIELNVLEQFRHEAISLSWHVNGIILNILQLHTNSVKFCPGLKSTSTTHNSHDLSGCLKSKKCGQFKLDFCDLRGSHSNPTSAQASAFTLLFDLKTPQLQTKSMAQLTSCWRKHHYFWGVHHAQSVYKTYNVDAVYKCTCANYVCTSHEHRKSLSGKKTRKQHHHHISEWTSVDLIYLFHIYCLAWICVSTRWANWPKRTKALKHVTKRRHASVAAEIKKHLTTASVVPQNHLAIPNCRCTWFCSGAGGTVLPVTAISCWNLEGLLQKGKCGYTWGSTRLELHPQIYQLVMSVNIYIYTYTHMYACMFVCLHNVCKCMLYMHDYTYKMGCSPSQDPSGND